MQAITCPIFTVTVAEKMSVFVSTDVVFVGGSMSAVVRKFCFRGA